MIEAVSIVNNLPPVPITDDPNDPDEITQVKLLLLRENVTLPNDRYSKR